MLALFANFLFGPRHPYSEALSQRSEFFFKIIFEFYLIFEKAQKSYLNLI